MPQSLSVSDRQLLFEKQHAPVGCGHGEGRHAVLSPWYAPLCDEHAAASSTSHAPPARQHAPVAGVQFNGSQFARKIQSPLGRQKNGSSDENAAHPPLGGHPKLPQFRP
jgi:hypothetical protein